MGVLAGIIQNTNTIKDCLADIKEKANAKGANINYGDDLNTWAGKIQNNIVVQEPAEIVGTAETYSKITRIIGSNEIIIPTKAADGTPMNTTLAIESSHYFRVGDELLAFKRIVFPDYYINVNLSGLSPYNVTAVSQGLRTAAEEVYCGAITIPDWNNGNRVLADLKRFYFPNATSVGRWYYGHWTTDEYVFYAPKMETYFYIDGQYSNEGTVGCKATITCPKVPQILTQNSNYKNGFRYWWGLGEFNSATAIDGISLSEVATTENPLVLKFPALTYSVAPFNRYAQQQSANKLYIGPGLTTLNNGGSNLATGTAAGHIEIHIPEGLDPTTAGNTAYTLTQAGVTYIEDYDYEQDLPTT